MLQPLKIATERADSSVGEGRKGDEVVVRLRSKAAEVNGAGATGARGTSSNAACYVARGALLLLGQALASDDAEAGGLRADDVLEDPRRAVVLLGGPDAWPAARHAVVQRYGRVGALVVIGYERRWVGERSGTGPAEADAAAEALDRLLDEFATADVERMDALLAEVDGACGLPVDEEEPAARRRLHASYAVAARDGDEEFHQLYMEALERVMRLARPRIAS